MFPQVNPYSLDRFQDRAARQLRDIRAVVGLIKQPKELAQREVRVILFDLAGKVKQLLVVQCL